MRQLVLVNFILALSISATPFLAFIFAFAIALQREMHGYNITSGCIRLCSAIVKRHRPDLRVALQDV